MSIKPTHSDEIEHLSLPVCISSGNKLQEGIKSKSKLTYLNKTTNQSLILLLRHCKKQMNNQRYKNKIKRLQTNSF